MPMMVRRANMRLSIAAGGRIAKPRRTCRHHRRGGESIIPSFGNAPGAAANAARALALSSSIWRTSVSTLSNFNSSRMKEDGPGLALSVKLRRKPGR